MFKRKIIDLKLARKAVEYYMIIPLRLVDVNLYKSVELSHRYNIYAYDAYFLECARSFNSPLLTLDERLMDVARQMNINIIEV